MRVFIFLLLFSPLLSWASDVQDAFDSGLFGNVIEDLRKSYKAEKLSIDEVFLLAKAYQELGQLRYARDVLTSSILSKDDVFSCKDSLSTKQCVDGFILLSELYKELDNIGGKNCEIKVSRSEKENNIQLAEKYLTKVGSNQEILDKSSINIGFDQIQGELSRNKESVLEIAKQTYSKIEKLPNTYRKYAHLLKFSSFFTPDTFNKELENSSADRTLKRLSSQDISQCSTFSKQEHLLACKALIQALDTVTKLKKENKQLVYPVWAELAKLYANQGYYHEARGFLQQAIYSVQAEKIDNQSENLFYWQWMLGKLLFKEGNAKNAVEAYESASYQLDIVKQRYLSISSHLKENIEPFYFDYMDALFKVTSKDSANQDLESKLITVIESLKVQQLKQYYQVDCTNALEEKASKISKTFKNFDDYFKKSKNSYNTAILYYALSKDEKKLAIILKQKMLPTAKEATIHGQVKDIQDIRYLIKDFRISIEDQLSIDEVKAKASTLYKILFRPIEDKLESDVSTLVIVPTPILHHLPFSALYDRNNEEYLVEKYNISISPAGSKLTALKEAPNNIVHFALLNGLSEQVEDYSPVGAKEALDVLSEIAILKNSDRLEDNEQGRSFTIKTLENVLTEKPYTIIHFLTHGVFSNNEASLLTYDSVLDINTKLTIQKLGDIIQNSKHSKNIELITFSACRTALGDDNTALGLAGVSVAAGARSSVATLWDVNNSVTKSLMEKFYGYLSKNQNKAIALAKSQKELLKSEGYIMPLDHPYYWAGFILAGNWL